MAAGPQFGNVPNVGNLATNSCTVTNTGKDGTGTIVNFFTAGKSGAKVDSFLVQALGTTTATIIRIFIDDLTTKRLIQEILVTAVTPSATAVDFSTLVAALVPYLPPGYKLHAAIDAAQAQGVLVFANAADL